MLSEWWKGLEMKGLLTFGLIVNVVALGMMFWLISIPGRQELSDVEVMALIFNKYPARALLADGIFFTFLVFNYAWLSIIHQELKKGKPSDEQR
jgi:hypothetical protein